MTRSLLLFLAMVTSVFRGGAAAAVFLVKLTQQLNLVEDKSTGAGREGEADRIVSIIHISWLVVTEEGRDEDFMDGRTMLWMGKRALEIPQAPQLLHAEGIQEQNGQ